MGLKRYYEEFNTGELIVSRNRQLEMCDIRLFSACTSLCARIHSDPVYCEKIDELKKITIPYSLLLNVIDAFVAQSITPDEVPTFHYGYDKTEYHKPVYPGDIVHTEFLLSDKVEKNEKFGVLTFEATTYNQHGEVVIFHIDKLYVGRKPLPAKD